MRSARFRPTWFAALAASALAATALAVPQVIHDDFDDGALDEAWEITFDNVDAWTWEEAGSQLVVTDIDPEFFNPGGGGPWTTVQLSQTTERLGDFELGFHFGWDSEDDLKAMGNWGPSG